MAKLKDMIPKTHDFMPENVKLTKVDASDKYNKGKFGDAYGFYDSIGKVNSAGFSKLIFGKAGAESVYSGSAMDSMKQGFSQGLYGNLFGYVENNCRDVAGLVEDSDLVQLVESFNIHRGDKQNKKYCDTADTVETYQQEVAMISQADKMIAEAKKNGKNNIVDPYVMHKLGEKCDPLVASVFLNPIVSREIRPNYLNLTRKASLESLGAYGLPSFVADNAGYMSNAAQGHQKAISKIEKIVGSKIEAKQKQEGRELTEKEKNEIIETHKEEIQKTNEKYLGAASEYPGYIGNILNFAGQAVMKENSGKDKKKK